ncbi:TPA: integrase core domain-containing protein, partial [Klebsiella michiganensis]|nr:transposase [Klebsiella michiganensis]HEP0441409.1 transposase [Klebsiella michiganensis]HEP0466953.1 transposase [Klebsiella michiganensis]
SPFTESLVSKKPGTVHRSCLFRTLNEAREITERWLMEYNGERPHESLNNLTPEEYRLMAEKPELSKSAWN